MENKYWQCATSELVCLKILKENNQKTDSEQQHTHPVCFQVSEASCCLLRLRLTELCLLVLEPRLSVLCILVFEFGILMLSFCVEQV